MTRTGEMLWDCNYCGAKGVPAAERHCPACGAPQDPEAPHYPADAQEAAAGEGPGDAAVGTSRLAGVARVTIRITTDEPKMAATPTRVLGANSRPPAMYGERATPTRVLGARPRFWLVLGGLILGMIGIGILGTWSSRTQLRVIGHSWERRIDIEVLKPQSKASWCDEMPRDAYAVSRKREVRSHRRVEDGQDCRTSRHDNGNGTFTDVKQCRPRYRDEPVYDYRCRYTVDRWKHSRFAEASGDALQPAPAWPAAELTRRGRCRGCEREGARNATYTLHVQELEGGAKHECEVDEGVWAAFPSQTECSGDVMLLTGVLDCQSLRRGGPVG